MIQFVIILSILAGQCLSKSIGTVNKARFTSADGLNSETIWIQNQKSSQQCLCTVLASYNKTLLFNSYSNGSCQLFFSLPYTYTMESHNNSTIILLSQLPPRTQSPCCSNLTWLMERIKNSSLPPLTFTQPTYLVIDDLDYLAVVSYNKNLFRYNRTSMTRVTSTAIGNQCMAVTYYRQKYFVGCGNGTLAKMYVLSTATLTSIANITLTSAPRDVAFIRNGTVMLMSLAGTNQIAFYNVTSPTSYRLTNTISAPLTPYALYSVSDTLLYMTSMTSNSTIHTLTYNATSQWVWTPVRGTNSGSFSNFQTTFDACGRIWISVKGYGIYIYDSTGTTLLYSWPLATSLNGIALSETFDLYASGFGNNQIFSFRPRIDQCTS